MLPNKTVIQGARFTTIVSSTGYIALTQPILTNMTLSRIDVLERR